MPGLPHVPCSLQVCGRYGFRFVNRPLLAFAPSIRRIGHAYRLPELWNFLRHHTGGARAGRTNCALRPMPGNLARPCRRHGAGRCSGRGGRGDRSGDRAGREAAPAAGRQDSPGGQLPQIDSPPLVHDPSPANGLDRTGAGMRSLCRVALEPHGSLSGRFSFGSGRVKACASARRWRSRPWRPWRSRLIIWRNDVVRLLPQTAAFFQLTGLGVNLRNLAFEDVKVSTETVNGSRVFVIEGAITPTSRKPVEVPRLRFVVQDARASTSMPGTRWSTRRYQTRREGCLQVPPRLAARGGAFADRPILPPARPSLRQRVNGANPDRR